MDQLNDNIQPKKKSSVLKWTLIGCGSLAALAIIIIGIGVYFISRAVTTNPAKVEAAAQEILSFDTPQGFKGGFSMNAGVMKTVVLIKTDGSDRGSTLILNSLPAGNNQESMRQGMINAMERQGSGKMRVVENRPNEEFRVQGKEAIAEVNLVQQSGDSAPHIQYVMTLPGASGNSVVLMMIGNEKSATHEWMQQFLDTVKSPAH